MALSAASLGDGGPTPVAQGAGFIFGARTIIWYKAGSTSNASNGLLSLNQWSNRRDPNSAPSYANS